MSNQRKVFSENLRNLIDGRGIDQKILADHLEISEMSVSNWVNGAKYPRMGNVQKIADYFGVLKSDIIEDKKGKVNFTVSEYTYLPASISAGLPSDVEAMTSTEKINIPDAIMGKWRGSKDIYFMRINGDSMDKVMTDQSLIAVKPISLSELKNGDMVVFSNDYEYSVKYYQRDDDKLVFKPASNNDDHHDQIYNINDNITIHGKVVLYIVEMD